MAGNIKPCLWMDDRIEAAVNFYVALFKDGKIRDVSRLPDGKVMMMSFTIQGQDFMALGGAREVQFTDNVSFFAPCKDQAEVDRLWSALTADGGAESMCGWLKDKYGVSWQIVPDRLGQLMSSKEPGVAARATQAMLKMRKIDIAALERAAAE